MFLLSLAILFLGYIFAKRKQVEIMTYIDSFINRCPRSLILSLAMVFALIHAPSLNARVDEGMTAPDFSLLEHASQEQQSLYANSGKIVVLAFYAYWCPSCKDAAQIPDFRAVASKYNSGGTTSTGNSVAVYFISTDECSNPGSCADGELASAVAVIDEFELHPVLRDSNKFIYDLYNNGGYPIYTVINGIGGVKDIPKWQLYKKLYLGKLVDEQINSIPAPTDVWYEASSLENSVWKWSSWMGFIYTEYYPWTYSADHGWLYSGTDNDENFWIWHPVKGWYWTTHTFYPAVYEADTGVWTTIPNL